MPVMRVALAASLGLTPPHCLAGAEPDGHGMSPRRLRETEERLEALGWTVLFRIRLAQTRSLSAATGRTRAVRAASGDEA